jgi:hypothetical protein
MMGGNPNGGGLVANHHPDGNDGPPGMHQGGQVSTGFSDLGLNDEGALGSIFGVDLVPEVDGNGAT